MIIPQWFRKAIWGLFIHWGETSIPARGEWLMKLENVPLEQYDLWIDQFVAEAYDPDQWADFAAKSGATYVVFTAKHHAGVCYFNTATTSRNTVQRGPKRDLVLEYVQACRRHNLKVGLYFSWPDWSLQGFNLGPEKAPEAFSQYIDITHKQVEELMTNYGKIDLLWFDRAPNMAGRNDMTSELLQADKLDAMIRRHQPDIVINDRAFGKGYATIEQNFNLPPHPELPWEYCLTLNTHWGYCPADQDYKNVRRLAVLMGATACHGGVMLLNTAPKPDGSLQPNECDLISKFGAWVAKYREVLSGLEKFQYPCDNAFGTIGQKGNDVYCFCHFYFGETLTLGNCAADFESIGEILSSGEKFQIRRNGANIEISGLPPEAPDQYTTLLHLKLK